MEVRISYCQTRTPYFNYSFCRWAEWNGKYRDDIRKFIKVKILLNYHLEDHSRYFIVGSWDGVMDYSSQLARNTNNEILRNKLTIIHLTGVSQRYPSKFVSASWCPSPDSVLNFSSVVLCFANPYIFLLLLGGFDCT